MASAFALVAAFATSNASVPQSNTRYEKFTEGDPCRARNCTSNPASGQSCAISGNPLHQNSSCNSLETVVIWKPVTL